MCRGAQSNCEIRYRIFLWALPSLRPGKVLPIVLPLPLYTLCLCVMHLKNMSIVPHIEKSVVLMDTNTIFYFMTLLF